MNAQEFFDWDFGSTLFPLRTNQILIRNAAADLAECCARILSTAPEDASFSFYPQIRVHAAKPKGHLRRTLVLDPICSYFIYDLVSRNARLFPPPGDNRRRAFGYSFIDGVPESIHRAYGEFQSAVSINIGFAFAHSLSFDIASYFNSIYHHDLAAWFASLPGVSGADVSAFGKFFREINSGRSVDFLPHGIYPAKMLGSAFLRYIDSHAELESGELLRFMDDFYLFDEELEVLNADFQRVQKWLGLRALNVNPAKTRIDFDPSSVQIEVDTLKRELHEIVVGDEPRIIPASAADFDEDDEDEDDAWDTEADDLNDDDDAAVTEVTNEDRISRLRELLVDPRVDETDVEKILSALRAYDVDLASHIPELMRKFPSIAKQLHSIAGNVSDNEALLAGLRELLDDEEPLIEYQLFWIAAIMEDSLLGCTGVDSFAFKLFQRSIGCKIARAKVLEIPLQGSGLKEARAEILQTGASDWESWAAAVGTRTLNKAERNHALKYFAKGSDLNRLVAECVIKLD